MEWSVLVVFLSIQLGIGLWATRRVSSEEDYLVAGRRLGAPLVTMSMFATWFGAETCLGSSGAVYAQGIAGGRADPFGYACCLLLLGLLLAKKLHAGGYMTLGDLYRDRFGRRAERMLVFVLVPGSILWGAAQLRAFGQVLATTSHLPVQLATILSATFAIVYTVFGGLLGDVLTDLVQGIVLCVGLAFLLGATLLSLPHGGPDGAVSDVALAAALSPTRLLPFPASESVWGQIDRFAIPIVGSLVTQEMTARVLSARTARVAKNSAYAAAFVYFLFGSIPVVLGLLGPALVPGLSDPEQLLPELARRTLPSPLYLLFACALLSAILSTVDSIFLSASTLLSRNWLAPVLGLDSDRHRLWLDRALVGVAGLLALWLALGSSSIYELLEQSALLGAAGLTVTTLVALHGRHPHEAGAVAALLIGLVGAPLFERLAVPAPFLAATACATATYLAFARFGRGVLVQSSQESSENF